MRWPEWLRRSAGRHRRPAPSPEAEQARARADKALIDVRQRGPRVDRVTGYLASEGSRNHWSERLGQAWRGMPDT